MLKASDKKAAIIAICVTLIFAIPFALLTVYLELIFPGPLGRILGMFTIVGGAFVSSTLGVLIGNFKSGNKFK